MNARTPFQPAEIAADADVPSEWTKQRDNMRSLALQLRRNSHMQRRWAREAAARGQTTAVQGFTDTAKKYAEDALWYWKRSRQ
jgi:hypothetical protein